MFGMCKIIPPEGWKPPFCVDFDNPNAFKTKEQHVHKLQVRPVLFKCFPFIIVSQEGGGFDDGPQCTFREYERRAADIALEWYLSFSPSCSALPLLLTSVCEQEAEILRRRGGGALVGGHGADVLANGSSVSCSQIRCLC
jgi:hypothetical protein